MRAGVGQLLLHVAIQLGALRIGRVARIDEAGIGHDAAHQLFQRLVFAQGQAQLAVGLAGGLGRQPCPSSASRTAIARVRRLGQVALQFGRIDARIEVGQIPFGQVAERSLRRLPDGWRGRPAHRGAARRKSARCARTSRHLFYAMRAVGRTRRRGLRNRSPDSLNPCLEACASMIQPVAGAWRALYREPLRNPCPLTHS